MAYVRSTGKQRLAVARTLSSLDLRSALSAAVSPAKSIQAKGSFIEYMIYSI